MNEDITSEMVRLSRLLDKGVQALTDAAHEYAEASDDYRKAKSIAYLGISEGTVNERNARVDSLVGKERRRRNLAEAQRLACLEAVRSRRAQLSALQSVAAGHRAELELARYGPDTTP